jgi:hypothetical protein
MADHYLVAWSVDGKAKNVVTAGYVGNSGGGKNSGFKNGLGKHRAVIVQILQQMTRAVCVKI